ncbi:type III-B CRISPR module RAMP protein Cmr1 [Teredinibacter turnerae]|uniref:type III-B CRISPR module RAMP protein Cmr1 n=1 Tax=Teredinibacter turnerae TaxID=2426 RepID=UPI00041A4DB1|nr:type III-B CRISPR module RAMP protein Cmr1 [Teredinibacter turnerae]
MPIRSLDSSPESWGSTIKANFQIITPMFLGGADQKASTIRSTAIKGALRFWWRAIYWAEFYTGSKNDTNSALLAMAEAEAQLFGAVAGDHACQSSFRLSVCEVSTKPQHYNVDDGSPTRYLLGQGLKGRNALVRGSFQLELIFTRSECHEKYSEALLNALIALSVFGGLGARARHGWGSVSLTALTAGGAVVDYPKSLPELKQWIKALPRFSDVPTPPFSAFSRDTKIDVVAKGSSAEDLLRVVGGEQQMYRSNIKSGKVQGSDAGKKYLCDYELVKRFLECGKIDRLPRRAVFGLPHNYIYRSKKKLPNKAYIAPFSKDRQRRASPLFLHIHQFSGNQYLAIHTLLVADYLPTGEQISASYPLPNNSRRQHRKTFSFQSVDWEIISTYLKRFKYKESLL